MSFDDREWRREEIRQQRNSSRQQKHQQHSSDMSVKQFLASQRKQHTYQAKSCANNKNLSKVFALFFLLIFIGSAAFLLYQWYL